MLSPRLLDRFLIAPGERVKLDELPTTYKGFDELNELRKDVLREKADKLLQESIDELASAQELLWASDDHAVLVVLQAMDAAGKDGIIKHVMSGVNPRSCEVVSFKEPSEEEVDHTFLWRAAKRTPERGRIGIFNRAAGQSEAPPGKAGQEVLGGPLRGHHRVRAAPSSKRHPHSEVLPPRLEGRAEEAVPRASRGSRKALEILARRSGGEELLGRLHEGLRGGHRSHEHRLGSVVRGAGGREVGVARDRRSHRRVDHSIARPPVPEGERRGSLSVRGSETNASRGVAIRRARGRRTLRAREPGRCRRAPRRSRIRWLRPEECSGRTCASWRIRR
jgi:hypothetical protein